MNERIILPNEQIYYKFLEFMKKKEENARSKKRTWIYIQNPKMYEIKCDKCNGTNIDWSEFESHIWCYDCKIDTKGTGGIFDGPVPIKACAVLGMCLDRYDMINECVLTYDYEKQDYVPKIKGD